MSGSLATPHHGSGKISLWRNALFAWLLVSLLFVLLYQASRWSVLSAIGSHAKGVAIAAAASLSGADLDEVNRESPPDQPAFHRIQKQLDILGQANPDIRYIYTMRRSSVPFAPVTAYEYVVDQSARDNNQDGKIGLEERSEPPGKSYDASHLPALVEAWSKPSSDRDVAPDPPYEALISGYAPVLRANGETAGVVGVDIAVQTVDQKLKFLRVVMLALWAVTGGLTQLALFSCVSARESREQDRRRLHDLTARHEVVRRAAAARGAPAVAASSEPRLLLERYDLSVAVAGGGLFRIFELDEDRVVFCLADPSVGGMESILLDALLDLFEERVLAPSGDTSAAILPYADPGKPMDVLALFQRLLMAELPSGSVMPLLYGVLDFARDRVRVAAAGCAPVLRWPPGGDPPVEIGARAGALGAAPLAFSGELESSLFDGDLLVVSGVGNLRTEWAAAPSRKPLDLARQVAGRTAVFLQKS